MGTNSWERKKQLSDVASWNTALPAGKHRSVIPGFVLGAQKWRAGMPISQQGENRPDATNKCVTCRPRLEATNRDTTEKKLKQPSLDL